jgi:aspartyl-tRNA(Asn)/glutamyl-tRNA(Gln) amidotransferase subunit B
MEEGSLRCDANISIRPLGETKLGTKVEVKNINSIRFVRKAIEAEIKRQVGMMERGEKIIQQTRGYDSDKDITVAQRDKEEAHDYRYFPCPDLPPYFITEDQISAMRKRMPILPQEQEGRLIALGLPQQDVKILAEEKAFAEYFERLIETGAHPKPAANWMLGPVKKWLNENNADISLFPLKPSMLGQLVALVESGKVNFSIASSRILPELIRQPGVSPEQIAQSAGLLQDADEDQLSLWVTQVLEAMPEKVQEYKKGKKGLIGLFVGEVKKISKGKADPQKTTHFLKAFLD